MKQIRRAEMENERLEETDNHNAKDNNDTTAEARADDSTTEEKGGKATADDFTAEETGNKARADYLAIEAKGNMARTEENSMNKGKSSHLLWEEKSHAMKSGWSLIREQRQEYKQVKRDKE